MAFDRDSIAGDNIVLIWIDDLIDVFTWRNAYGVEIRPPNLDALMARGVRFSNSSATAPLCAPCRAELTTGLSPFRTGLVDLNQVVILGTGHAAADHPYTLTRQHYGTPLGRVETDVELVEEIARRAPVDPFEAELLHEQEHSIEFQAVFHRLARGPDGPRIVPVLCGSFHEFVETRRRPLDDERVRGFVEAVRAAVGETGRRVQYLASIDLSHMGPRYGDEEGLDEEGFLRVEKADRDLLARAAAGDLDGFFEHQVFCRDERRVCGFSALYTLLALVPGLRGRLLRYEMTTFPGTKDTVGHCAMAFSRESPAA